MVEMPVGHEDLGRALQRFLVVGFLQHRVAVEPWIDQQHLILDLDAERAVAQPDDVHVFFSRLLRFPADPSACQRLLKAVRANFLFLHHPRPGQSRAAPLRGAGRGGKRP